MNGSDVKEAMKQVHISSKMQEEIIMNVQERMENKYKKTRNWKRMTTAAAAVILTAGVISIPVQAVVNHFVQERMESIPEEEVQDMGDMIQEQEALADGFSREYSESEKERSKELWQSYENGTFPEENMKQVDNTEAVTEGTLCYVKATGVFYLPDREMTDEEILQIIDFQHKMNYALSQTAVTEEEREAYRAEEARLEKIVQDHNGISWEEAVEIARKQLASDLGAKAEELELMTDWSGSGADLMDISGEEELESKAGVGYDVGFGNTKTHYTYGYVIDAVDGSILTTWEYVPGSLDN